MTTVGLTVVVTLGGLVALDLSLHQRFEKAAGLNYRGYRGAVVTSKRLEEQRVVVLGGSTAFGYGVTAQEAFPAILERKLAERQRGAISVVNLAYNNEGAYSFLATLQDYATLDYDVAILYEGYNDLDPTPNLRVFRRESPVFRWTGYYPILPLVVREKLMALRHGGNLEAAYRAEPVVFRPQLAQEQSRRADEARAKIRQALEASGEEAGDWTFYCWAMERAVRHVIEQEKTVMVVAQPYQSERHIGQQEVLVRWLRRQVGDHPRVRYVNLGRDVVDLHDPALCYDGAHLTLTGNERIAEALVEPLLALLGGRRR